MYRTTQFTLAGLHRVVLRAILPAPLGRCFHCTTRMATPSSSSSPSSFSSSSPSSFVPECPVIQPVTIAGRTYRQVLIPRPRGAARATSAVPSSSSTPSTTASSSPSTGNPPPAAQSLSAAGLLLLSRVQEDVSLSSSSVLTRFSFSVTVSLASAAAIPTLSSPQHQTTIDHIQTTHQTIILIADDQHDISQPHITPNHSSHSSSFHPLTHLLPFSLVVQGAEREAVVHTALQVEQLLHALLDRLPYTHFLCLPLPSFTPAFRQLQSSILSTLPSTPGLDPSIFVRPTSLHLTLAMLQLPTPALIQHANHTLTSLLPSLSPLLSPPLSLHLRSLSTFQSPSHAHVVFIQPDPAHSSYDRLTEVCRRLIEGMMVGGVLSEREVNKQRLIGRGGELGVKLHVTLINTKHRRATGGEEGKRGGTGRRKQWTRRQAVDATEIFRQYGEVDFGEGVIDRCEISQLQWDKATEFYTTAGKITLRTEEGEGPSSIG